MADAARGSGSRFIVDLGEVKLPAVVEKHVEAEIQAAVLRALAAIDERGDSRLKGGPFPIFDQNPGQTLGLWLDPSNQGDQIRGVSGRRPAVSDDAPLASRDHTLIVGAIMERPLHVLGYLPGKWGTPPSSGEQVLEAALQVEAIDDHIKNRIRVVLEIAPKIEEAQAALPASVTDVLASLTERLAHKTLEEQISVLRDPDFRRRHRKIAGLADGMEVAAQITEDGQGSIYSPEHRYYALLADLKHSAKSARGNGNGALGTISNADQIGATAGAVIGSAAGGVGAAPGAVTGAALGSGVAAVVEIGAAIWSWFD